MNLRTQIAATNSLHEALRLAAEASAGAFGILHIADGAFKGAIYLESGRITAAQIVGRDVVSLQALQEIVQHKEAVFLYKEGLPPPGLKRVNFPFQELLKEGLQLTESSQPSDRLGSKIDSMAMQTHTNLQAVTDESERLTEPEE